MPSPRRAPRLAPRAPRSAPRAPRLPPRASRLAPRASLLPPRPQRLAPSARLTGVRSDLVNAFRALRASRAFTLVALTVLGLGIGAGTAIFSVVDAVVLRGLPFDEHDRLGGVYEHDTKHTVTF